MKGQTKLTNVQPGSDEKKEDTNKIRNETGEITADTFLYFSDIQKMIRIYYEQLNASKYINIY